MREEGRQAQHWLAPAGNETTHRMTELTSSEEPELRKVIDALRQEIHDLERQLAGYRRMQRASAHLAALVDSSDDAIVSKTLQGRIESWNPAAERLFGYSPAEAIGRSITLIIPPERLAEEAHILETIKRGERIEHFETIRMTKDGRRIEVSLSVSPIRDASGSLIGASKIARDITARRRTEAQLHEHRESIAQLNRLIELAFEAILVWDWNGGVVQWNHGCEQLYGFSREEALGRVSHDLLGTRFPQSRRATEEELLSRGAWAGELRHRAKDGSEVIVDSRMQLLTLDGRRLVLESNRDITERKRAEEALKANEERYRQVLESLPQLVWTCRADGAADYFSRQWFEYTGTRLEEDLGYGWTARLHEEDRERALGMWARCLQDGQAYDADARIRGKDGRYRWFKQRASPIIDAGGSIEKWFGTSTDITDLIEAREIIRRANVDLERRVIERTQQLEDANSELQAFAHSVAHDLRAPLRNIQGYASALLEDEQDRLSEEGALYARRMAQGAVRLDGLIQDLLAYSRLSRAEVAFERVDLDLLIKVVLEELAPEIAAREARISVAPHLGVIRGNRAVLGQVLTNLVSNAIKFVPQDVLPSVDISGARDGNCVLLTVADNGIGIAPEHHERIFRVFERLHGGESYPGTGIGLAIVRRGIERLGGRVHLESTPGKGSRFTIALPSVAETASRGAAPHE
jgi:PAS domain S-box-containing protein